MLLVLYAEESPTPMFSMYCIHFLFGASGSLVISEKQVGAGLRIPANARVNVQASRWHTSFCVYINTRTGGGLKLTRTGGGLGRPSPLRYTKPRELEKRAFGGWWRPCCSSFLPSFIDLDKYLQGQTRSKRSNIGRAGDLPGNAGILWNQVTNTLKACLGHERQVPF